MKKSVLCLLTSVLGLATGCARLTITHGEDKAVWTSLEPFRTRSTHVEYNPETKTFIADLKREQAISPEMVDAVVQTAGIAAAAYSGRAANTVTPVAP